MVDQKVWVDAVDALTNGMKRGAPAEGFTAAIRLCGEVLAEHFPPSNDNPDELPNVLVELPER
jgi:putative membrane protein